MSDNPIHKFMNSSAMNETATYIEPETSELVCFCKSCGTEVRYTIDTIHKLFQFAHKESCEYSDEKRTQRLVSEMINVVGEETDYHVKFSAVTFYAMMMCATAAQDAGEPLETMTNRFARMLEDRIHDFGPFMESMARRDTAPKVH
jgi:hypothetical protein